VSGELEIVREEGEEVHCWPTVDPDVGSGGEAWWNRCRPLRVELDRGDVLFLPSIWYHKVSQEVDEEGVCCAVNYWYDMGFGGSFYSMANFIKSCALIVDQEGQKKGRRRGR
jgi:jumonji domain-containing protein 7